MKKVGTVYTKGTEEVNFLPGRFHFPACRFRSKGTNQCKEDNARTLSTSSSND